MADRIVRDELYSSARFLDLGLDAQGNPTEHGNTLRLCFLRCTGAADDLGNFEAGPGDLVRLWRDLAVGQRDDAERVFRALQDADLVRVYEAEGKRYGHIPRWRQRLRHFKHAHPRPPSDVECPEISDLMEKTPDERQTGARRKSARARTEVKGSEGKGSEAKGREGAASPKRAPPPVLDKSAPASKLPTLPPSGKAWESYRAAYAKRYGADPVRNAKVNASMVQLVARLGAEEAPQVAAYYLTSEEPYYVKRLHDVGALVADAEKLRTEWKTGRTPKSDPPAQQWWKTEAGIMAEAKKRGVKDKPGESMSQFIERIRGS